MSRLFVLIIILIICFFMYRIFLEVKNQKKKLFDNMQEGFALYKVLYDDEKLPTDYKIIDTNKAFEKITGLNLSEIKGKRITEILKEDDYRWIKQYAKILKDKNSFEFIRYYKDLDKYFSISVYKAGKNILATILLDITKHKKLQKTLKKEREFFKTTLHSIGDGIISTDFNGLIEIMNPIAENLTGYSELESVGKKISQIFKIFNKESKEFLFDEFKIIFENGEFLELENFKLLNSNSKKFIPIEILATPVKDNQQKITGMVIIFKDITEKQEKQEEIIYLSYHDQLTGLYNRRFFEEELKRLDTTRNLPLSIAMIDVNGLKLTNDAFGHKMGDQLLKKISEILKNEFRADDIIARVGGDEFVVILPSTTRDQTEKIMMRIYKSTENQKLDNILVSASMGWDVKENENQFISDILVKAEENMYRRKLSESKMMRKKTIQIILKEIQEKIEGEFVHSQKVARWCKEISKAMDLGYEHIQEIELAGFMHDIGKISINSEILKKVEPLTEIEFDEIKRHSEIGYQILKSIDEYAVIAEYILSHHEHWDGSGYPRGLKEKEIPLGSRIIMLADSFEAMTSSRAYRKAMSRQEALDEIKKSSGKQFDPEIVKIFEEKLYNLYF